jgi:hypothetical protein
MKKQFLLGVTLTAALFVSLLAATPLVVSAATKPCIFFTHNGIEVGSVHCDIKANDITVIFKNNPTFTTTQSCPTGANNLEINWGIGSTGATEILSCVWTKGSTHIGTCPIIGATEFTLANAPTTRVFWTINGVNVGRAIQPPKGSNGVEMFQV